MALLLRTLGSSQAARNAVSFSKFYQGPLKSCGTLSAVVSSKSLIPANGIHISKMVASSSASTAAHGGHNHGLHWSIERVVSVSLLGLLPTCAFFYHPAMDYIMSLFLCLHSHWGLHGIVVDYIRPKLFGGFATFAEYFIYVFSFLAFGSIMYFNYTDVGLIPAVKMLWRL
ncbi:unnamed protein product [Darwinula stevensoni]|uniref:Succinate dehydrogenase [ubiquinone] cytochrome b small subunit n=1 Tax=Darwinula stevensoni TaxID=69355 RepID=A0A7R9ACL9_9CRUS|nr:unnamed protein product [Darwinula stevensoni]CAG0900301.1 unnamed protein product [Darwinula stevensoni]